MNAPERISSLHASAVTNHGESPVGDGKRKTIGISQHVIYEVDTKEPPDTRGDVTRDHGAVAADVQYGIAVGHVK